MNLQTFATQTTTTNSTGNSLSAEMKTFYEKRLIDTAKVRLVHDLFADRYPIPKGNGKQIEFRRFSPLAAATTPITEGVTPDAQSLNVTSDSFTLKQYGGWIQLSDMLELTAIDNTVVQATKLLGNQAGRTLDTITRDVLNGGTNVMYAPKTVSNVLTDVQSRSALDMTSKLTVELIYKAKTFLAANNASPIDDCYVAIVHPYVAYDLMRDDEWIDAHKYGNAENLYNGEIGRIGGVRFVESTDAKIWRNNTCPVLDADEGTYYAVFSTLVLGANAYGVTELEGGGLEHIVKQLGYGDDPLNQRSSVGWKATRAAERLVENYMVRIESLCSYSDNTSVSGN